MPLDATGYVPSPRVLTPDEADDLAVLKAARHLIRHRWRWWQIQPRRWWPPFRHCALTAVSAVVHYDAGRANWAHRRLDDNLPSGFDYVSVFNDSPSTTHADVLALFDRAIAELE